MLRSVKAIEMTDLIEDYRVSGGRSMEMANRIHTRHGELSLAYGTLQGGDCSHGRFR